ncbi:hypothetical protein UlMin_040230 [Ulmus minor]
MAGALERKPSIHMEKMKATAIREPWEVQFARFFFTNSPPISTSSGLVPLPPNVLYRRPIGNWLSTSSNALMRLVRDFSNSNVILTVCMNGKMLEEHYISKLLFSWPQASCMSGFPPRGARVVIVSYTDCAGEIQKFALRFSTIVESEEFMNTLKGILKRESDFEPISSELGSEISSVSELMSSNRPLHGTCEYLGVMTPSQAYTPELPANSNNQTEQHSSTQNTLPTNNFESNYAAFPPSFTSMLTDCYSLVDPAAAQLPVPGEVDLKSQIAKYMEDSSFQDMLIKVEKVINEMGGDLTL